MHRSLKALIVTAALATSGAAVATIALSSGAGANGGTAHSILKDAGGNEIGSVKFVTTWSATEVRVTLHRGTNIATAFHGFHIHANADGAACSADPALASTTWFTAVGGHWKAGTQTHGQHLGDMPSLFVNGDGSARARFTIDRISVTELRGKAVIVHAGPDNFGNVPVGGLSDQYSANTGDATTKTQNTGNAGDRIACGVIVG